MSLHIKKKNPTNQKTSLSCLHRTKCLIQGQKVFHQIQKVFPNIHLLRSHHFTSCRALLCDTIDFCSLFLPSWPFTSRISTRLAGHEPYCQQLQCWHRTPPRQAGEDSPLQECRVVSNLPDGSSSTPLPDWGIQTTSAPAGHGYLDCWDLWSLANFWISSRAKKGNRVGSGSWDHFFCIEHHVCPQVGTEPRVSPRVCWLYTVNESCLPIWGLL